MRKVIFILALFVCSVALAQSTTEPKEKKTNSTEQAKSKEKPKKRGDEPKYLIRNKYPKVPISFVSIKPSPVRA